MTMSDDMSSGVETCPYCLGEANGIHKIIVRSDGVAIPCSGGDVCALRARVAELESDRDAARRDREAAECFRIGENSVQQCAHPIGKWAVWDRFEVRISDPYDTRDAALAEARRLAGDK